LKERLDDFLNHDDVKVEPRRVTGKIVNQFQSNLQQLFTPVAAKNPSLAHHSANCAIGPDVAQLVPDVTPAHRSDVGACLRQAVPYWIKLPQEKYSRAGAELHQEEMRIGLGGKSAAPLNPDRVRRDPSQMTGEKTS